MSIKDDQLILRYFKCKKKYKKDFHNDLINRFPSTYEFCNRDINNFIAKKRSLSIQIHG